MKKSIVKHKLKNGEPVLVNKICFFNTDLVEMMGLMGFDCLWICNEHAAIDGSLLKEMIRAARRCNMDCVIRTGERSHDDFICFLEMGANGLMIPHLRNAEHAEEIVRRSKFPPIGERGIDGVSADADFGLQAGDEYIKQANDQTFIVVQIEDESALDNIESIARVEGIDVLFVGPADLSLSMGIPNQVKHPKILEVIKRVVRASEGTSAVCGTSYIDHEHGKKLMNMGVKFFTGTSDSSILRTGFANFREAVRDIGFTFHDGQ